MDERSRAEQLERKRSCWTQYIESWQKTGLTQTEDFRRHNLKHHQLVYWKKRFTKGEAGVSLIGHAAPPKTREINLYHFRIIHCPCSYQSKPSRKRL